MVGKKRPISRFPPGKIPYDLGSLVQRELSSVSETEGLYSQPITGQG